MEEELDYWQLPVEALYETEKEGDKLAKVAMEAFQVKAEPTLSQIFQHILQECTKAAKVGAQSFSIEFKESQQTEYYAFLSNFSNREILLHQLLEEHFEVSFNDLTSGQGHSYILFINLWNRYRRPGITEPIDSTVVQIFFLVITDDYLDTNLNRTSKWC